jgi:hypothetical protein
MRMPRLATWLSLPRSRLSIGVARFVRIAPRSEISIAWAALQLVKSLVRGEMPFQP